jgi:UDP-GlcNAc:undecaprenyl-phosphate/decaprenyl-phosphate GlcNAc-1-phosphate transferase
MIVYVLFFIGAAAVSFALTPLSMWVATKAGAMDRPDARKVHHSPTPRLGGLAIFGTVVLLLGLALGLLPVSWGVGPWPSVIIGALIVYLLGFTDDVSSLGPKIKLLVQILAALVAVQAGIRLDQIVLPGGESLGLGYFSVPLTVFWIVGVTNAFNLIDGLDGLAGGLALIAAFTLFALSHQSDPAVGIISVILAGALAGFLRYNFHPARIFMGDSGSLFVGYLLACLSLHASIAESPLGFVAPILAVAIPVLDTATAMLRRYFGAIWSRRGERIRALADVGVILRPDRAHIHHRLLDRGLSQRQAVFTLYVLGIALAVLGVFTRGLDPTVIPWVVLIGIGLFLLVRSVTGGKVINS